MEKPQIIWVNVFFFSFTFFTAAVAAPLYGWFFGYDLWQVTATVLLLGYAGMSITMGYHRLWSHRTFDAHPAIRVILALGGALAIQNSILHWSSDHREHHRHVDDNDKDPYSARRGFWFSHIGWMLREYQAQRYHDYQNVKDLQRDPVVVWQHKHYWQLAWLTNLVLILVIGLINGDMLGTLLLAGFVRLVLSQHFTFFINSLAHMWGSQPYSDRNTAKDNALIAFLTYGEGYHNFHHRFASDYRNGIRWWQFDPTKWAIRLLAFTGLARNLRRYTDERVERARASMQLQRARSRLERLPGREQLLHRLQTEYELLVNRMHACFEAKRALFESRKRSLPTPDPKELARHYKDLKSMWREQRRQWKLVLSQALEVTKGHHSIAKGA